VKNIASNLLNHLGNSGIGGQVGRCESDYLSACTHRQTLSPAPR